MSARVTIVDYGVGNLLSVARAFQIVGAEIALAETPEAVLSAERLVIPGVGAFADGIAELGRRNLIGALREFAVRGNPILGICLGMQLLFTESEEFGLHNGLDILPGRVVAIPNQASSGKWRKTPHIGWNELLVPANRKSWQHTLLAKLPLSTAAYFLHSFAVDVTASDICLAECDYDGFAVAAVVQCGPICGCQFHPEKSGPAGLLIIENFLTKL